MEAVVTVVALEAKATTTAMVEMTMATLVIAVAKDDAEEEIKTTRANNKARFKKTMSNPALMQQPCPIRSCVQQEQEQEQEQRQSSLQKCPLC